MPQKKPFRKMDAGDIRSGMGVETLTGNTEADTSADGNVPLENAGESGIALVDSVLKNPAREHAEIPLDRLYPNPKQPRKYFDDETIRELAEDIRENGLIEEIVVRKKDDEPGAWETICGERRSRACRLLGWVTIPAQVRVATNAEMLRIAIAENDQKEALTPYDRAVSYDELRKEINETEKREISVRDFAELVVHKNKDMVQLHFNLLKCDKPLLAWAREDPTVSLRIVDELRRIEDSQVRTELMQLIRAKIFNQDEVIALAKTLREEAQRAKLAAQKEADRKEAKQEPSIVPTDSILRLALRTKAIAGDHKKVASIITRYRQDMIDMNFEEKALLQKQITTWIGELQSLLEV